MNIRRAMGSLLGALLLFGMLALPASAGVQTGDVVILNGQARVGDSIAPLTRIPEQGNCNPTGKGLHAPGFHGSGKNKAKPTELGANAVVVNKEVFYRLEIPTPGVTAAIVDTNNPESSGDYVGSLDVCGIVSPGPAGIGAACGSSTGRDGKGKLDVSRGAGANRVRRVYMLQNVSWVTAVAGALPVYGHITEIQVVQGANPGQDQVNKRTKLTAKGTFQGAVNASNAVPCTQAKPGGARTFTVNGTVSSEALGKPAPKARETKLKKQN